VGGLAEPAAADDQVVLEEEGGLAGCDGSLGLVEGELDLAVADGGDGGGRGLMAVSDLGEDAHGFAEVGDADPVELVDGGGGLGEEGLFADDDAVVGGLNA